MPLRDINMRIPDAVKKCVVFIGIEAQIEHVPAIIYLGTGFIVSVKSTIGRMSFIYLVTARHIVASIAERDFYIRANTKDGKSSVFKAGVDSRLTIADCGPRLPCQHHLRS